MNLLVAMTGNVKCEYRNSPVPEFIDPVLAKTSPKRSFSMTEKERFGLLFANTGSIISGTVGRIHERRISLRFLAIILRVLRLEVSVWIS